MANEITVEGDPTPPLPNVLYRYFDYNGAVLQESYFCEKHTPKGVWINTGGYPGTRKFVLLSGRKRWAYPTQEEALQSYIKRKEWHQVHLARQTKLVDHCLHNALDGRIGYNYQLRESSSYAEEW